MVIFMVNVKGTVVLNHSIKRWVCKFLYYKQVGGRLCCHYEISFSDTQKMNSDLDADRTNTLPKKTKRKNTDRISTLPKNVTDAILACLPIRDAVRTSILSRGWRYEWSSLSQVVLDDQSFTFLGDLGQPEYEREIVKIVDRILLLHCGPVTKFKFSIELESCTDIDRWILFLSRNGIKELILDAYKQTFYNLPSRLFSCANLSCLDLHGCSFIPPPSFKGFSKLTSLVLSSVQLAGNALEILLSECPLLEDLTLQDIAGCSHLEISAPELVNLKIEGAFIDLYFKSMPRLTTASISFSSDGNLFVANRKGCRIVDVFGQMHSIQRLELLGYSLDMLICADVPVRIPVIYPLNHLVAEINFEDEQEMIAAFCIFRCSPIIQKLDIQAFSDKNAARKPAQRFWERGEGFDCAFSRLQTVEMTDFSGVTSELKFIEYVLANAPVLERVHVKFVEGAGSVLEIFRKLVRFPRSSAKAEIVVPA